MLLWNYPQANGRFMGFIGKTERLLLKSDVTLDAPTQKVDLIFDQSTCFHPLMANKSFTANNRKSMNDFNIYGCYPRESAPDDFTISEYEDIDLYCDTDALPFGSVKVVIPEVEISPQVLLFLIIHLSLLIA